MAEDGGLHAVREWCRDRVEESLEDQGMINQQLDQVSYDQVQDNMTSISDR